MIDPMIDPMSDRPEKRPDDRPDDRPDERTKPVYGRVVCGCVLNHTLLKGISNMCLVGLCCFKHFLNLAYKNKKK